MLGGFFFFFFSFFLQFYLFIPPLKKKKKKKKNARKKNKKKKNVFVSCVFSFCVCVLVRLGVVFLQWLISVFFCFLFFEHHLQADPWLLVTRTCGARRCRYRGHWRSGTRHLFTRSRVYAQEWHCKDIHSHIHSHPIMHSAKTNEE